MESARKKLGEVDGSSLADAVGELSHGTEMSCRPRGESAKELTAGWPDPQGTR